ncbi:hypothetical protein [Pseudosporangium ferrugineum]|uniref:NPCBM/NEW2 domain-containing protein n=1 Tax=Pseudosporangium ferrugineum TaxID=439699 RepID=A0A2T0S525_9ACTN|nr:hypothetical protein [Pseudosporangium ferrugineum]PRY28514.1 hypothetical protein CLV70_108308 [Pseudosporangium ferrugineum]
MNKIFARPVLALAAVGVFTTAVASGCGSASAPNATAANGAAAAAVKPVSAVAPAAPLGLSDRTLKFSQKGAAVTASKNGKLVATLTLTSATYGARSGRAVFSMDAKQPVLIDTSAFTLYDTDGGENSADSPRKLTLKAGKTTLTLTFSDTHDKPAALGWIPQNGTSDGGLWERPAAAKPGAKPVDLSDDKLKVAQKGAAVTVSKRGAVVATLTLTSATYGTRSGRAVFSMDAKQPVLIDTSAFTLYDTDGGENSADSPRKLTLKAGKTTLTLTFSDTHDKPAALGWAGAVWER